MYYDWANVFKADKYLDELESRVNGTFAEYVPWFLPSTARLTGRLIPFQAFIVPRRRILRCGAGNRTHHNSNLRAHHPSTLSRYRDDPSLRELGIARWRAEPTGNSDPTLPGRLPAR